MKKKHWIILIVAVVLGLLAVYFAWWYKCSMYQCGYDCSIVGYFTNHSPCSQPAYPM